MGKFVYLFSEGNAGMRNLLGGKGANLAEMTRLGLPVPRGFTITTEACTRYYEDGQQVNPAIAAEILAALQQIETQVGKKLGDPVDPFLVSVRSGARASMPGMMDTILNLGLNDATAEGLGRLTQNPRFALDSYRRFIMMFGDVVKGVDKKRFEAELEQVKQQRQAAQDTDLDAEAMAEVVARF
ncbi:MAG: PEP/pyruvate-binding domain-containing protein, partial [Oscillospiraceae bacterium]|nr:PEP/pyruvate-binding domain-containing protein [Oscillospiraceae bacterium]